MNRRESGALAERVMVRASDARAWTLRLVLAKHAGRCPTCQRGHREGAPIYLAHGLPLCPLCVARRPAECADWVASARAMRSRITKGIL